MLFHLLAYHYLQLFSLAVIQAMLLAEYFGYLMRLVIIIQHYALHAFILAKVNIDVEKRKFPKELWIIILSRVLAIQVTRTPLSRFYVYVCTVIMRSVLVSISVLLLLLLLLLLILRNGLIELKILISFLYDISAARPYHLWLSCIAKTAAIYLPLKEVLFCLFNGRHLLQLLKLWSSTVHRIQFIMPLILLCCSPRSKGSVV